MSHSARNSSAAAGAAPPLLMDLLLRAAPLPLPARPMPTPGARARGAAPGARTLRSTGPLDPQLLAWLAGHDEVRDEADAPAAATRQLPPHAAPVGDPLLEDAREEEPAAPAAAGGKEHEAGGNALPAKPLPPAGGETAGPELAAGPGGDGGRVLIGSGTSARSDATWLHPASATVKLVFTSAGGSAIMCSGALVTQHHVLTAAHCVLGSNGEFNPLSSYYAIPGQGDLAAPFAEDGWSRSNTGECKRAGWRAGG